MTLSTKAPGPLPLPSPRSSVGSSAGPPASPQGPHAAAPATPAAAVETVTPPLRCEVLDALVAARAAGAIKPAQQLAATNIKGLLDTLLSARNADVSVPRNYYVGDIEGRVENQLKTLIDAGVIAVAADGTARFTDAAGDGARVVFLGDIGDRGPVSIRARKILSSLAAANPGRVDYTWGNRCIGKLGLLNALPLLEQLEDPAYAAWLSKRHGGATGPALRAANALEERVQYWLETHSARDQLDHHKTELTALEEHRQELSIEEGRTVTLAEAAHNYVESLKPGGEYFEFLRLGNWGVDPDKIQGPVLAFHSGGSATSIAGIPGDDRLPVDARDWNTRWLALGEKLFAQLEAALLAGRPVPSMILELGDSDYDTRTQKNGAKNSSNTYGPRHRDHTGNYGAMSSPVAAFYAQSRLYFEMVAHMPQPMPLMLKGEHGVAKIYNDMSFVEDGSQALVVSQGDLVVMAGRRGDAATGELVFFSARPKDESPLGMVTENGYAVHSLDLEGRYNLMRVANGRQIDWQKVTPEELAALKPQVRSLDEKTEISSEAWFASLGADFTTHTPDTLEAFFGDRTPVWVSGASSFGEIPVSEPELDRLWQTLGSAAGDALAFITGGTNAVKDGSKAPEYRLHEVAAQHGVPTVGFIPEQTNTSILGTHDLYITGKKSQWDVPLQAGIAEVSAHGGAAVLVGGGPTITRAITKAAADPAVPLFLVVGADFDARVTSGADGRGASEQSALDLVRAGALPAHFHLVRPGTDLGALVASAVARSG